MTFLLNSPADFSHEAVQAFAMANHQYATAVHGGVVRSRRTPAGQPALVVGGGSGHYPAFAGWVGPGMAHGAPCGNVFASPSTSQVYSVARNAENGGGVILGFGNYAGDVLHFGSAAEKLRAEGIDVRIVAVSDDLASNPPEKHRDRRGIAGDLPVFKIAGAAIEAGADLGEAERIAWKANDATRSLGAAFDGCTLPGADDALFGVGAGTMGVGLGIHGEPGIKDLPMGTASEVADLLFDGVIAEAPEAHSGRVAVVLNGLGRVKYEELFVVYARLAERLEESGLTPVQPEVGEFVTSLDMAGLSLTLVFLDDELEQYWLAPADTPAYRRGLPKGLEQSWEAPRRTEIYTPGEEEVPPASADSRALAAKVQEVLELFEYRCRQHEEEWGRIDAIAGDGDHGHAMVIGSGGAVQAGRRALGVGRVRAHSLCTRARHGRVGRWHVRGALGRRTHRRRKRAGRPRWRGGGHHGPSVVGRRAGGAPRRRCHAGGQNHDRCGAALCHGARVRMENAGRPGHRNFCCSGCGENSC